LDEEANIRGKENDGEEDHDPKLGDMTGQWYVCVFKIVSPMSRVV
jgi:hypothetical protein